MEKTYTIYGYTECYGDAWKDAVECRFTEKEYTHMDYGEDLAEIAEKAERSYHYSLVSDSGYDYVLGLDIFDDDQFEMTEHKLRVLVDIINNWDKYVKDYHVEVRKYELTGDELVECLSRQIFGKPYTAEEIITNSYLLGQAMYRYQILLNPEKYEVVKVIGRK